MPVHKTCCMQLHACTWAGAAHALQCGTNRLTLSSNAGNTHSAAALGRGSVLSRALLLLGGRALLCLPLLAVPLLALLPRVLPPPGLRGRHFLCMLLWARMAKRAPASELGQLASSQCLFMLPTSDEDSMVWHHTTAVKSTWPPLWTSPRHSSMTDISQEQSQQQPQRHKPRAPRAAAPASRAA